MLICNLGQAKRGQAEKLDGSDILKSDRDDLSTEEAWRFYMLLTRAENAFRSMKSPLLTRPVHHQLEARVVTYIFLSVPACPLLVAIEKTRLQQEVHTSGATLRETGRTLQGCTVMLPADGGSVLRVRRASTPENHHSERYAFPASPQRSWPPGRRGPMARRQIVTQETRIR